VIDEPGRRVKKELWLRLRNYHFDDIVPPQLVDRVSAMFGGTDASTRAFASKLSRKLGWKPPFALRAIGEYKKFVFLGTSSDISVTPSKVIDQVWHEHILFSRGYREFCANVLTRDFDHSPELVPADDQNDVFASQYLQTLDAYRVESNAEPPADIWSVPKFQTAVVDAREKKRRTGEDLTTTTDTPLFMYFDGGPSFDSSDGHSFGGGGEFAGGGADRSWGDGDSSGHADATDAGDSGSGDSGSSCSSSSCSSSCSSSD
jgi:hypothetical protein